MRKQTLYTLILLALVAFQARALSVVNTAGGLSGQVSDLNTTQLTVTGTMNAEDFYFIADNMLRLTTLDLSGVEVVACTTRETHYGLSHFGADAIPMCSFASLPLTTVSLPSGIVEIGEAAFADCRKLASITLPSQLVTIGDHAFSRCEALTSVELPASVTTVGDGAFARCTALNSFTATGLQQLSRTALMDCPALTQVSVGSRVQTVGERAFAGSGVKTLNMSGASSLTTVGEGAFVLTPLTSVSLPTNLSRVGEAAFLYVTTLTTFAPPGKLATLSDYLLAGSGLSGTLTLTNVDTVGAYTLYNASDIKRVSLSANIKHLKTYAMAGMTGMTSITCRATQVPSLGASVWQGVKQSVIPLVVPTDVQDDYKSASQWRKFLVQSWIKGDVNNDGEVTIADVNAIIDIILGGSADDDTMERADVNEDGEVTIADVNAVLDIILSGGDYDLPVNTDDGLTLPAIDIEPGEEVTVVIGLANAHPYSALQCDITLPQGLELVGDGISTAQRSADHINVSRARDAATTRTVLYSMTREEFAGNEGGVLTLTLRADKSLALESEITLRNIMLADNDNVNWHCADVTARVTNSTGIDDAMVVDDRVWVEGSTLHIATRQDGIAQVVAVNGTMRELSLQAGDNEHQLDNAGIYIVRLNGKSHKVVAK